MHDSWWFGLYSIVCDVQLQRKKSAFPPPVIPKCTRGKTKKNGKKESLLGPTNEGNQPTIFLREFSVPLSGKSVVLKDKRTKSETDSVVLIPN